MHDAVIIPLVSEYAPFYSSKNVVNVDSSGEPSGSTAVVFAPNIGGPDLTNVYPQERLSYPQFRPGTRGACPAGTGRTRHSRLTCDVVD